MTRIGRAFSLSLLFVLARPLAFAGDGDTLITDPKALVAMGFPPDATDVYLARGALLDQKPGIRSPTSSAPRIPATPWIPGNDFMPGATSSFGTFTGRGDIFFVSGDPAYDARIDIPTGAVLQSVRWWGHDNNATDLSFFVMRSCLPAAGAGFPDSTTFASGGSTGTPLDTFGVITLPAGVVIANQNCHYDLRLVWAAAGNTLRLYKAAAQWRRQVSPAPPTATFNDVPVGHPQRQFIEALFAAGITGGCGANTYCPDATLTRGQMAVFLATALGLHWPNSTAARRGRLTSVATSGLD